MTHYMTHPLHRLMLTLTITGKCVAHRHSSVRTILMSLPELTPEKVIKLQKNDIFFKKIIQDISHSKYDNYFIDVIGILHKKVIDLNTIFSAIVIPQILIKYFLHSSNNLFGHVGATKLYHFLKQLYYFQGMRKKITSICEVMPQM